MKPSICPKKFLNNPQSLIFALQLLILRPMNFNKTVVLFLAAIFAFSCASKKDLLYLQDVSNDGQKQLDSYEPTLKTDDLLSIIISAETPEVTIPFNMPAIQGNYEVNNNQNGIKTYLIDNAGNIEFPVIGTLKLAGLTRAEAVAKIGKAVSEYIINPQVNLRILNYKVSVLGEVNAPGSFVLESERVTLLEALSRAGDLTIYGNRHNILVIREIDGKKSFNRLDITKSDFMTSPFYYLTQNDVVVVEPNQARVNMSSYGQNLQVILGTVSLLVTIAVLIFK